MRFSTLAYLCLVSAASALVAQAPGHSGEIPSERHIEVVTDPTEVKWPWLAFKSSPHTPPNMTITGNGKPLADGYIFMTPQSLNDTAPTIPESGGFIRTSDGDLVFALNASGITDFRRQYYNGKEYLTYWSGFNSFGLNIGHGFGQVNFLDDTYQHSIVNPDLDINTLEETNHANWSIDIHEHQMTSRNTLLVSAYNNTPYDLSPAGGPANGWLVDSLFFELNVSTWEVLFVWKASEHVALNDSHQPHTIMGVEQGTEQGKSPPQTLENHGCHGRPATFTGHLD
jgi:hypothetical protein